MRNGQTAVMVHCGDPRIQPAIQQYVRQRGLDGRHFPISGAGGVKSLLENGARLEHMRHQARVLSTIEIGEVVLINHLECRDYGHIGCPASERAIHKSDLRRASTIFLKLLSEAYHNRGSTFDPKVVPVTLFLAGPCGHGWKLTPISL